MRGCRWFSMTQGLGLHNNTRLLVLVPHPDDETLATGGLIQLALAVGASLRIVIVTDGDNNPWPQRWLEKRWRIDATARARWGTRRRTEAAAALARLGVAATDIRHYGWPDQGLTASLMRDAQGEDQLVAEIADFAPDLIVAPALEDRHPDHSALRVMLELALARSPQAACARFGFVVHGPTPAGDALVLAISAEQARLKQHALQAHASQLVLSGKRMQRLCQRVERFQASPAPALASSLADHLEWQMPWPRRRLRLHAHALYLIVEIDDQLMRTRVRLPNGSAIVQVQLGFGERALDLRMQASTDTLALALSSRQAIGRVFAKIERLGARVVIYDRHGWVAVRTCRC